MGENGKPDGSLPLLDYSEDGVNLFMIFVKAGLEMEKTITGLQ